MKLIAFNNNKYLKGQERTKLYDYNKEMILSAIETQRSRKKYLEQKGEAKKGFRGMFFEALEKDNVTVKEAMEYIIKQGKGLKEEDVIRWMREELLKGNLSKKVKEKIQDYLKILEKNKSKDEYDERE